MRGRLQSSSLNAIPKPSFSSAPAVFAQMICHVPVLSSIIPCLFLISPLFLTPYWFRYCL
ncbi:hypothetical protein BDZ45DRAFT_407024 [Acephala macrosclerotiorum]|nr:hypothetical protein BDZ45DRAFT_407024 [Acephala macrosclerotiorum]